MRLRLLERLRQLVSWRPRFQADPGRGRAHDSRPREDAGRHRRGATQSRAASGGHAQSSRTIGAGPLQPPAGLSQQPAVAAVAAGGATANDVFQAAGRVPAFGSGVPAARIGRAGRRPGRPGRAAGPEELRAGSGRRWRAA